MVTFVEGLEDRTAEIRSGACAALAILEVKLVPFCNVTVTEKYK